jgi:tRNA (guanine-N7-)-methyltransferase
LVSWVQRSRPIDWPDIFGRKAELHLEIGFGLGDFLARQALANPGTDWVGLEPSWVLVRRALRKIALAGISNVRILQIDAGVALERVFEEKSLQRIYSLFPCPWPKKRHIKNRLFSTSFLALLNSRLADGGRVQIVTDERPYLDWILPQVVGTGFKAEVSTIPPRFQTKYERKWQKLGQEEFYEACLIKDEHVPFFSKEELELRIRHVDHFDPEGFVPESETGEIAVEFKEILYDSGLKKGMVRTVVSEGRLLQDFWIEIARVGNRWRIRPARGCSFIPTSGAQKALDLLCMNIEKRRRALENKESDPSTRKLLISL